MFPNAFGPTWTLIGLTLGNLPSGVAVTETVFSLPGLGRLLVDAIYARDYPVIQYCMLFIATLYVLTNLLIDALYPLFNPRVSCLMKRRMAIAPNALLGIILIGVILLAGVLGFFWTPFDPGRINILARLQAPVATTCLAPMNMAAMYLSRLLAGASASMTISGYGELRAAGRHCAGAD